MSAIADLDRAIGLDPKVARFYGNRGLVLYMKRDYEGAVRDFDDALEREPGQRAWLQHRDKAQAEILRTTAVQRLEDQLRQLEKEEKELDEVLTKKDGEPPVGSCESLTKEFRVVLEELTRLSNQIYEDLGGEAQIRKNSPVPSSGQIYRLSSQATGAAGKGGRSTM
jgi:tetratricopeptide (TPR) repeat protein